MEPLASEDPEQIGGYQLRARLGAGGMGRVYLGFTGGGHPVAVKVIRPDLAGDEQFRHRFRQEVAAAARVHGLYTAQLVDSDTEGGQPWLATAYVAGPSLAEALASYGPMPAPTVLLLVAGVAEALQAIHAAGVVHRDLKPSNVLLAADGPKVIDFGIARAAESTSLTATHMRVGSVQYMAPEQVTGEAAGPAVDIFALGSLAMCAATGRPPFGEGADQAVLYRVVNAEPDLAGCPDQLRDLITRCLARDPAARPSPAQVVADCRDLNAGQPLQAAGPWLPAAVAAGLASHAPPAFGFPAGLQGPSPAAASYPPAAATPPAGTRAAAGPTPPAGFQPTMTAGPATPAGPGSYGPPPAGPGYGPPAPGPGGYGPPTPPGYGPGGPGTPGGYGPAGPGGYGPGGPAGYEPGGPQRRSGQGVLSRKLVTAAAAAVVVALVAVLVAVHPWSGSGGTAPVADQSSAPAAATSAPPSPSPTPTPPPSPAPSPTPDLTSCLIGTWKMSHYSVLNTINGSQVTFNGTGATFTVNPNGTGTEQWPNAVVSAEVSGNNWTETISGTMTWDWTVQGDQILFTDGQANGSEILRVNGAVNNTNTLSAEPGAVTFSCSGDTLSEEFPNGSAVSARQ